MATKSTPPASNGTVKTEGPVRSQRLQSFKVPRDLSLGASSGRATKEPVRGGAAAAANKKVFTPNLNVTRHKSTASVESTISTANGRGRGDRGRGRGGGPNARGRGKAFVQSIGLFSEGIAGQPMRRSYQSRPSLNEGAATQQLIRPTLTKPGKVDENEEKDSLEAFMNDGEDDGHGLDTMMALDDDFTIPVVLMQSKSEPTTEQLDLKYPESLQSFFQRTTPQLFLIQLPDTLPGQGNEVVEVKKTDGTTSTEEREGNEADAEAETSNFCLMKGLQEGLAGKFIRYKSGKTKLVLGNTRFDADLGLDPGLQEVVSVRTNAVERSGDMINLGKINAKVNISPDWEEMFQTL